jgi:hypothetical protein
LAVSINSKTQTENDHKHSFVLDTLSLGELAGVVAFLLPADLVFSRNSLLKRLI